MSEYEKKILLSEKEYIYLLKRSNIINQIEQTNFYFDTDDLLMNSRGITCRIRKKGNQYKAVVKWHIGKNGSCSVEENLYEKDTFDAIGFEKMGLKLQGELLTVRTVIHKDEFCEIVLDKNSYLGYTDFELEIEYDQGHEEKALQHLKSIAMYFADANITNSEEAFMLRVNRSMSKSKRFFERKGDNY